MTEYGALMLFLNAVVCYQMFAHFKQQGEEMRRNEPPFDSTRYRVIPGIGKGTVVPRIK